MDASRREAIIGLFFLASANGSMAQDKINPAVVKMTFPPDWKVFEFTHHHRTVRVSVEEIMDALEHRKERVSICDIGGECHQADLWPQPNPDRLPDTKVPR